MYLNNSTKDIYKYSNGDSNSWTKVCNLNRDMYVIKTELNGANSEVVTVSSVDNNKTYTVKNDKIKENSLITVFLNNESLTDDQYKNALKAHIVGGSQSNGQLTLRCLGDNFTDKIPIIITIEDVNEVDVTKPQEEKE